MDANDQAVQVELVPKTVGRLALKASKLKGGESTVQMSWAHPKAWKQLASLTLAAFDGTERIGSITMTPATGKLAARGALQLTGDAKLSHKGKAVTAALGLKVDGSVPAGGLRLQVEAIDKAGNQQTELGAGFLR
jgi:hypothetical protein